jgi:hypothetical protein
MGSEDVYKERDYFGVRCVLLARWDREPTEAVRLALQNQPRPATITTELQVAHAQEAERLIAGGWR